MISFARGAPALECLDADLLADCARAAIHGDRSVLAYGPGGGYRPIHPGYQPGFQLNFTSGGSGQGIDIATL